VGRSDLVTPISSSNGHDSELSKDDGSSNGSGNFLSALDSESNVSISISNDDESFESGSLTSTGLLLDGHNLHNLILDLGAEELINDLIFLDGESKKIDLLEFLDQTLLN